MLVCVGDEVAEREAVMGGDEIDRGGRAAAGGLEDVGRSGKTRRQRADSAVVARTALRDVIPGGSVDGYYAFMLVAT